ncbi:hypothetical protein F5148DRAFT_1219279 [Russula earlei]|uniref:Uncharacterized protein n=1 Tax=Russula earlei TaxID=71964 RepID=A0ACC0U3X0_9AGAM|nr:hypothetical protein F5148DRAFT_1219279 [Russula earlei]
MPGSPIVENLESFGLPFNPMEVLGMLLMGILLNAFFFGVVTQQFYQYWNCGFEDHLRVKVFVVAQFVIMILQDIMYWQLAWNVFIDNSQLLLNPRSVSWKALANCLCQVVLIMMANAFLAVRIHSLTRSRMQSGLVLGFSAVAFIVGTFTLVTTWSSWPFPENSGVQRATAVIWHVLQAIAECLIMFFLSRVLLASRSGIKRSDSLVHHLVRNVIQIGLLATIWSMAALGTYFLLPRNTIDIIFDATSGSIYTHMIYDALLSRVQLRSRLTDRSQLEIGSPSQTFSHTFEVKRTSAIDRGHGAVSFMTITDFGTATQNSSVPSGIGRDTKSELDRGLAVKSASVHDIAGSSPV